MVCEGRADPRAVGGLLVSSDVFGQIDDLLKAGVQHFILRGPQPFDMKPLEELLRLSGADGSRGLPSAAFAVRARRIAGVSAALQHLGRKEPRQPLGLLDEGAALRREPDEQVAVTEEPDKGAGVAANARQARLPAQREESRRNQATRKAPSPSRPAAGRRPRPPGPSTRDRMAPAIS